ncbi:molecular chaperone [Pseudomonas chlororaphis subsp. piscium]|nr:molecular chaperone [Pseudomonas chlororaphis subsp. piscium]
MKNYFLINLAITGILLLCSEQSKAAMTLDGTRAILVGPKQETSILVINQESEHIMIQSWVDSFNVTAEKDIPFAITPSLNRVDGNQRMLLRIFYYGQGLPTDRESVFRLNVQEVPRKSKSENSLQIAVRQRIKLFYLPANLKGSADEAPAALLWRVTFKDGKPGLEVRNDSAFHVSFGTVNIKNGSSSHPIPAEMIPPYTSQSFAIAGTSSTLSGTAKVEL